MSDIFISYAREDRKKAKAIATVPEAQGWSVWWGGNIPPGRSFDLVIEEALSAAQCVVVLWSRCGAHEFERLELDFSKGNAEVAGADFEIDNRAGISSPCAHRIDLDRAMTLDLGASSPLSDLKLSSQPPDERNQPECPHETKSAEPSVSSARSPS